jgi:hypothetical protein
MTPNKVPSFDSKSGYFYNGFKAFNSLFPFISLSTFMIEILASVKAATT